MPSSLSKLVRLTYRCLYGRPHRSHVRLLVFPPDPAVRCPGLHRTPDAAARRNATAVRRVERRAARRRRIAARRGRG